MQHRWEFLRPSRVPDGSTRGDAGWLVVVVPGLVSGGFPW
jgi:hypothetical protein